MFAGKNLAFLFVCVSVGEVVLRGVKSNTLNGCDHPIQGLSNLDRWIDPVTRKETDLLEQASLHALML